MTITAEECAVLDALMRRGMRTKRGVADELTAVGAQRTGELLRSLKDRGLVATVRDAEGRKLWFPTGEGRAETDRSFQKSRQVGGNASPAAGRADGFKRSHQESVNPYVFVVGVPRSGTTLLQRMLDAHPQLSVINEAYWLGRDFRQRAGVIREGLATKKLVRKLLAIPKFRQMRVTESELLRILRHAKPVRYEHFASLIVDWYAARCGKPLVGDKTPNYVARISYLHEMWPRARFVHIIRDPRDVCLSMLDWDRAERNAGQHGTWELDPIVSSTLFWRLGVSLGRQAGAALGPDLYRELRYEDLVGAPARRLREICTFLDLPYAEAMLNYHHGRTSKPWRSSKAQWLPPTPGLRKWESEMAQADVERVEAAAGDLLVRLGYASSLERRSAKPVERVAAVCELFTAQLRASGEEVPEDWPC